MIIECHISIDTPLVGATSVYGVSELENILKAGGAARKYDVYVDKRVVDNNNVMIVFMTGLKRE